MGSCAFSILLFSTPKYTLTTGEKCKSFFNQVLHFTSSEHKKATTMQCYYSQKLFNISQGVFLKENLSFSSSGLQAWDELKFMSSCGIRCLSVCACARARGACVHVSVHLVGHDSFNGSFHGTAGVMPLS